MNKENKDASAVCLALTTELNFLAGALMSTLRLWAVANARAETMKSFINQILN